MKILGSTKFLARPGESRVGVGTNNSRAKGDGKCKFDRNKIGTNKVDGGKVRDNEVGKKVQKTFKSKKSSTSKKTIISDFYTLGARLVFTK